MDFPFKAVQTLVEIIKGGELGTRWLEAAESTLALSAWVLSLFGQKVETTPEVELAREELVSALAGCPDCDDAPKGLPWLSILALIIQLLMKKSG